MVGTTNLYGHAHSQTLVDKMYTICTMEEWRTENFDPYYYEMVYGVFFNIKIAKVRAREINGVVVQMEDDVVCKSPDRY